MNYLLRRSTRKISANESSSLFLKIIQFTFEIRHHAISDEEEIVNGHNSNAEGNSEIRTFDQARIEAIECIITSRESEEAEMLKIDQLIGELIGELMIRLHL